jgi:flagellar motor protein MotB
MKYLTLLIACIITLNIQGQKKNSIKIYTTEKKGNNSAEKLIQSLIGEGVILKNYSITKARSLQAFGFFEDKKQQLGMENGLVMSTESIADLSPQKATGTAITNKDFNPINHKKNEGNYPPIEKFINYQKTFDACVIEFDVVPTADTLSFNYVFGSNEYDQFVGTQFNDIFAFLISGKNIGIDKNLAVVPNTQIPVSINTINGGRTDKTGKNIVKASNSTFFVSNSDHSLGVNYNGVTRLMQIRQPVIPYETYHIRLCIADVSDRAYDSGVFIEGKSFIAYDKTYNVLFNNNDTDLEPGYKTFLENLTATYKNNPQGAIIVTGHTDESGNSDANMSLSCARANKVAQYLKQYGISDERIIIDCKGETMPAFSNQTGKGAALNRRVEIKVTGDIEVYQQKKREKDQAAQNIESNKSLLIKNFPNPFKGQTTLDVFINETVADAFINITDIKGNTLKTIHILERGNTTINLNLQEEAIGTFIATLITDGVPQNTLKLSLQ